MEYLHALNLVKGMHYMALKKLWRAFGDWQFIFKRVPLSDFVKIGLTEDLSIKILQARKNLDPEKEFEKLQQSEIRMILPESLEFPFLLKQIPDPPFFLYCKGKKLNEHKNLVSIVGTRMPSTYGEKIASEIAENISLYGGTVVSGLAFGIDAIAHFAAVKNKKSTIAVLPSGLKNIVPQSHTNLAEKILENNGTLITEYTEFDSSYKGRYLERNRLISGLSKATIVIEAKQQSGALITAAHALQQNRDIYALPGDITRAQAQGCLKLFNDGAIPIISITDVLKKLGFESKQKSQSFNKDELFLLEILEKECASSEDLLYKSKMELSKLNVILSMLELNGVIQKNLEMKWESMIVLPEKIIQ